MNDSGSNGDATAGDKVYTLQFSVNDTSPATHFYGVSYKSISSGTTFSTEIDSTTSAPIVCVSDSSSYSQNIQDSINRLLSGATSYQAIYPSSATSINQTALDSYTTAIASVMGNIQQLSSYDAANPLAAHAHLRGLNFAIKPMAGGFSFWSLIPFGLGDILKKNNELAPEKKAFLGASFNPSDPAVTGVMTWLAQDPKGQQEEAGCDPDIVSDSGCRAVIWGDYAESPSAGLLEAAKSSAISFAVSEYTPNPIDGAGDLLASQTDLAPLAIWSIKQAAGIATDYFVDNYTAPSGRQMLVFGNVSQGQTTMLPNGSHDIILASSSTRTETPGIVSPAVTSLLPASLQVGAAPGTLTINGTGFLGTSTVTFNGVGHTATFVSASQLTISLTLADLAVAGSYPVVVTNPAPGGGASAAANFSVASTQAVGQWIWMGGSNTLNCIPQSSGGTYCFPQQGMYGTLGVPDSSNVPAGRNAAVSWTDSTGNLWLFGGNDGFSRTWNDLWEFNPIIGEWTWMSGDQNSYQINSTTITNGVYGTIGVSNAANVPASRPNAVSWVDDSDNLWLFGGLGFGDTDSNTFFFNDLWRYSPAAKEWTWMSGDNGPADAASVQGVQGVPAPANTPGNRYGAVSWKSTSGDLWLFGGFGRDPYYWYYPFNDLWRYSPTTNEWTWITGGGYASAVYGVQGVPASSNDPGSRYGSISWTDANGNLWLFGGNASASMISVYTGLLNDLWEFNPTTNEWTWISGANIGNKPGVYGTQGEAAAANVPGARQDAVSWTDKNCNLWLFGGTGYDSTGVEGSLNDLWKFDPLTNIWTWVGGNSTISASGATPGVYGTRSVPASANYPGARTSAVGWTDKDGNLWLFGGAGTDSNGNSGNLNDLWRYQP